MYGISPLLRGLCSQCGAGMRLDGFALWSPQGLRAGLYRLVDCCVENAAFSSVR